MTLDFVAVQAALKQHGYGNLGTSGPAGDGVDGDWGPRSIAELTRFQQDKGLPADGVPTQATLQALGLLAQLKTSPSPVPKNWLVPATMKGIVVHWTAGANKASAFDKSHYHILIEDNGTIVRGAPKISDNALSGLTANYAAHTWQYNRGMIGVSLCCMGGGATLSGTKSKITAFTSGNALMSKVQWNILPSVLAQLCLAYGIPVGRTSVLSHAEVEGTLGIVQKDKWDIAALSFEALPAAGKSVYANARAIGDRFRSATSALMT